MLGLLCWQGEQDLFAQKRALMQQRLEARQKEREHKKAEALAAKQALGLDAESVHHKPDRQQKKEYAAYVRSLTSKDSQTPPKPSRGTAVTRDFKVTRNEKDTRSVSFASQAESMPMPASGPLPEVRVFCYSCGTKLVPQAPFCAGCGTRNRDDVVSAAVAQPNSSSPERGQRARPRTAQAAAGSETTTTSLSKGDSKRPATAIHIQVSPPRSPLAPKVSGGKRSLSLWELSQIKQRTKMRYEKLPEVAKLRDAEAKKAAAKARMALVKAQDEKRRLRKKNMKKKHW